MDLEEKFIDSGQTGLGTPSASGSVQYVSGVATGTDYNNRIGRSIYYKRLELKVFLEPKITASSPTGDIIRTVVVLDRQPNGSNPAAADILQNNNYTEPYQVNNRDRFEVLYDKFLVCEANAYAASALTVGDPKFHYLECVIPINQRAIFSGTTAAVASVSSGAIFILFISAYASWTATYNSRIVFTDS